MADVRAIDRAIRRSAAVLLLGVALALGSMFALGYAAGSRHDHDVLPAAHTHTLDAAAHGHEHPRSGKWPKVRADYLAEHPACEACGRTAKTIDLEVHHVKEFASYPELELVPGNLVTLCRDDHFTIGHAYSWRTWNPHVREDAALVAERIKKRKDAHER